MSLEKGDWQVLRDVFEKRFVARLEGLLLENIASFLWDWCVYYEGADVSQVERCFSVKDLERHVLDVLSKGRVQLVTDMDLYTLLAMTECAHLFVFNDQRIKPKNQSRSQSSNVVEISKVEFWEPEKETVGDFHERLAKGGVKAVSCVIPQRTNPLDYLVFMKACQQRGFPKNDNK
jgi:hypothetical protein